MIEIHSRTPDENWKGNVDQSFEGIAPLDEPA